MDLSESYYAKAARSGVRERLGRFAMDERVATGALRVATLNLWGRRGAWEERRRVLAEGFRELEPDLVAFQ